MALSGLLVQVLSGLQYGLLLFLLSSGLTLVFGVVGVINLAHGSLFMLGAYLAFAAVRDGVSLWLALALAVAGGAVFGALLERLLFRRFRHRGPLDQVLLTFALILLFEEARTALTDDQFHRVAVPAALDFSLPLTGGVVWPAYRLVVLAVCLAVAAAMFLLMQRTRFGAAVRAAAESAEMVELLGIDPRRLRVAVFAIATALAMLAGALAAPVQPVYPGMGQEFLIVSFVVVVIGGLGSMAGTFWAALLVGLTDTLCAAYLPALAGVSVYGLMAAVLLWRPAGLFARV